MRRLPWDVLLALLAGLGLGLVYAWVISPLRVVNADPSVLRADFQDHYRSVIAAAYAATGNLPRARARLALLGDADSVEALNAQAQRMLAGSAEDGSSEAPDQVAALALALDESAGGPVLASATVEIRAEDTSTSPPGEEALVSTETPEALETSEPGELQPTAEVISTPRPTRTPTPEPGQPFALSGQETVCDPNLPDGLLQVLVLNRSRRQLAGIEIVITWAGGREQFFTGLKPELGNGYADYLMSPDTAYAVQLARGSDVAEGLTAPTCQSPEGVTYPGSIKLTFQQP